MIINPFIDKSKIIEKKNPDLLIGTTFKLGINEDNRENKAKLILPHQEK